MSTFNKIEASFNRAASRVKSAGADTPRDQQLLAALTLPFFLVALFLASVVAKDVLLDLIPSTAATLAPIGFFLGFFLLVADMALVFFWVRTGGFSVFA